MPVEVGGYQRGLGPVESVLFGSTGARSDWALAAGAETAGGCAEFSARAAPRSTITCVSAIVVHTISTSKAVNVFFDILRRFIGLLPCLKSLSSTYIGRGKGVKVTPFLKIK